MILDRALVSPKSTPTMVAIRSNSAIATSPQLRPPITSRMTATRSTVFIDFPPAVTRRSPSPPRVTPRTRSPKRISRGWSGLRMDRGAEPGRLRIGELSRRLGISHHLLRAWERRYGLLRPQRSAGGFRLYSAADLRRVRRMQEHLAQGLSAAEAAGAAIAEERSG